MTNYSAVLRELLVAGYEGAPLLAAFERLCAAIGSSPSQKTTSVRADNANERIDSVRVEASRPRAAPVVAVPPPENAKAIARKAIAQSMLPSSTIAVASHLVERFNLNSGRCDPGVGSIARDLGLSTRTVYRATAELVASGLFGRARHGGRGHANAYQPNWPLLVERAAEGDVTVTKLARDPATSVTQNHLLKPDSDSMLGKDRRKRAASQPDLRQRTMVLPITGGRDKAEAAVRKKLRDQLNDYLKTLGKKAFVEGLTVSIDLDWGPAIVAEMQKHGQGLAVLLHAIDERGRMRMGWGGLAR